MCCLFSECYLYIKIHKELRLLNEGKIPFPILPFKTQVSILLSNGDTQQKYTRNLTLESLRKTKQQSKETKKANE